MARTTSFHEVLPSLLSYNSLSNLYRDTTDNEGNGWINKDNWLTSAAPKCDWYGVRCNDEDQVTELHLASNNLTGTINLHEYIQGLPYLEYINLSNNTLTGTIQSTFFDGLEQLKYLNLSSNAFEGTLPEVQWSRDLGVFDIDKNQFVQPTLRPSSEPSSWPSSEPTSQASQACLNHMCMNGSTCIPDESGRGYTCNCNSKDKSKKGSEFEMYYGDFCEIKACINNGICIAPQSSEYTEGTGVGNGVFAGFNEPDSIVSQQVQGETTNVAESPVDVADIPQCTPGTYRQHKVPQFMLALGSSTNSNFANEIPPGEVEGILSVFLTNIFATVMGERDVSFITTLKATETSSVELASNQDTTTLHERRLAKEKHAMKLLKIDSNAMIQDCAFSSSGELSLDFASAKTFLPSAMSQAFQNRTTLLNLFQSTKVPALQSIDTVELADKMEVCPNQLRCQHGSKCLEDGTGDYTCDCSIASDPAGIFTIFDGPQCEYAATEFCSTEPSVMDYSYCVNHGSCKEKNVGLGETHPGCVCQDGFEGSKCESKRQPRKPLNKPAIILSVGGAIAIYALFYKPREERKYCKFSFNPISYLRPCFQPCLRLCKQKKLASGSADASDVAAAQKGNSLFGTSPERRRSTVDMVDDSDSLDTSMDELKILGAV